MDSSSPSPRTAAQRAGDAAERLAADHLVGLGWTILGRNIRVGRKELDLVGLDPGPPRSVVLVEVRWRARRDFGLAEETFDQRKRVHLRVALSRLIEAGSLPNGTRLPAAHFRIDLIVIEPPIRADDPPRIRHHRNALG